MAKSSTSFEKGKSGNKKGKPRGKKGLPLVIKESRKVTQKEFLQTLFYYWNHTEAARCKDMDKDLSMGQVMIRKIFEMAGEGSTVAFKEIIDRLYGQSDKKIEVALPKPTIIENIETGKAELIAAKFEDKEDE